MCGHLLQQRLQTAFEEHLKAEVVLNDKGGLQTAIYNLHVAQISEPRSSRSEEIAGVHERPSHLLPDVVMREETAQFTFSERSTMIRVLVSWQHMNPQSLDISLIHRSERGENEAVSEGNNTSH